MSSQDISNNRKGQDQNLWESPLAGDPVALSVSIDSILSIDPQNDLLISPIFFDSQPHPKPPPREKAVFPGASEKNEEILDGSMFEASSPHSLNYVTGDAGFPSFPMVQKSGPLARRRIEFFNPIRSGYDSRQKRGLLDSFLAESYPGVQWSRGFWPFLEVYQDAAIKVFGIQDSPYRKATLNFRKCYREKTKGKVYVSEASGAYYSRKHCCEPGCLLCNDLARKRLTEEWLKLRKRVVARYPEGFKGFLSLNFTLPKNVESLPFEDGDTEQKLLDAIQRFVREVFGLNTRANIAVNMAVHPVGDNDLFRDRWHCDVNIIPSLIENGQFRWVEPIKVSRDKGHRSKAWKLDLDWCRHRWGELLSEIFYKPLEPIQPQVEFVPSFRNAGYWQKRVGGEEGFQDGFWKKVRHQLGYNLRSFSRDCENSLLRTDPKGERFVLKAKQRKWEWWYIVDSLLFAERFRWIRTHNRISTRGWAQCLKKYQDVLGAPEEKGNPPSDVRYPVWADVSLVRQKRFDSELRQVVWDRDELYQFDCPLTGERKTLSIKEMEPWAWEDLPCPLTEADWESLRQPREREASLQGSLFEGESRGPPLSALREE